MKKLVLLGLAVLFGVTAQAFDTSALQLSIWAPRVQLVPDYIDISGLKLNLPYGGNKKVIGVDLGIASINDSSSSLQVNFFNRNIDDYVGFQVGLINLAGSSNGVNIGLFNSTESISGGLKIGLVNASLEHRGLQIGLVNYCEFLTGIQIGLANIVTKSTVPFFPILNFCF